MIHTLKLASTFHEECESTEENDLVFFKLEIVPGEVFQIASSMLENLRDQLEHSLPLLDCELTDSLPYGRCNSAEFENDGLFITLMVPKNLQLRKHSYASTDDLIKAIRKGTVQDFSIGLYNVRSECNTCGQLLSNVYEECCEHWQNQIFSDDKELNCKITDGTALFISTVACRVTDYENTQLLIQNWDFVNASIENVHRDPLNLNSGMDEANQEKYNPQPTNQNPDRIPHGSSQPTNRPSLGSVNRAQQTGTTKPQRSNTRQGFRGNIRNK